MLPNDYIAKFFLEKEEIFKKAMVYDFVFSLESFIERDVELKRTYQEFLQFPLGEKFSGSEIGHGMNGRIDRGIVGALTLLNHIGFETWSSCHGHCRFDEAGLEGGISPSIYLTLDEVKLNDLYSIKVAGGDKYFDISIYPLSSSSGLESFAIRSGSNLILESLDSNERAIVLSFYLSILNNFIFDLYTLKTKG